ncbi:MAG: hypothetical protein KGJ30_00850, partial [Burkholderiales bacterium]|nr:hypothetical protein [Burkholderiales bacterium]
MEPNHAIADLIQANGGPCAIDKIHLPYEHAGSGPAAKFGLGAELFLSDPDRAKLRERSIEFLIDFWNMFPNRINEFLPDGSRRTKKFRGDTRGLILNDSASHSMEDGYGTMLSGAVDIGLPKDDVDPYQAHVLASRSSDPRLSFVSATMPIC